jgi:hypothetical protein
LTCSWRTLSTNRIDVTGECARLFGRLPISWSERTSAVWTSTHQLHDMAASPIRDCHARIGEGDEARRMVGGRVAHSLPVVTHIVGGVARCSRAKETAECAAEESALHRRRARRIYSLTMHPRGMRRGHGGFRDDAIAGRTGPARALCPAPKLSRRSDSRKRRTSMSGSGQENGAMPRSRVRTIRECRWTDAGSVLQTSSGRRGGRPAVAFLEVVCATPRGATV